MACTNPLQAQRYICGSTGVEAIRFRNFNGEPDLQLPCNKCPSCKLRKAKEWALRLWHESQMHDECCFVTLTYDDEHLPAYENLKHRDFQLFMKRLREKYEGRKILYYMCGEYGDRTHRPHYHVVLFNYYPPDAVYHRTHNKNRYYKSAELDKLWRCGFTDTSAVTYHSAGYVARYTLKKQLNNTDVQERYVYLDVHGDLKTRKFEYVRMSLRPGLGLSWFKKYYLRTVQEDCVLDPNGNPCPVPRYYLHYLRDYIHEETYDELAAKRLEKAQNNPDNDPSTLPAKRICTEARLKQLPRPYL